MIIWNILFFFLFSFKPYKAHFYMVLLSKVLIHQLCVETDLQKFITVVKHFMPLGPIVQSIIAS